MAQKKSTKKKDSHDPVYVGIFSSTMVHRLLLESNKSAIMLLKQHDRIMELRKQRKEVAVHFDKIIKAMKHEIAEIRSYVPEGVLNHEHRPKRAPKPAPKKEAEKKEIEQVRSTQLSALDKELADIESALQGVSE